MSLLVALALILVGCEEVQEVLQSGDGDGDGGGGIVTAVMSAPIVPDGDVAGAPTDIVITLDTSLDPDVTGRSLMQGKTIKVTLPHAFRPVGDVATKTIFGSEDCVPGNVLCNTGVLLQGWPQHPILPLNPPSPPGAGDLQYSVSAEGSHTIVYTANIDIVPGLAAPGPGIKQMHLLLPGFVNPVAGIYDIHVAAETGPGGALEEGTGRLAILPTTVARVSVTSAFNAGSPNTMFQTTSTESATALPYDLLLWDAEGLPLTDVTIEAVDSTTWSIVADGAEVGDVELDAPEGAEGQALVALEPSYEINAPVLGVPAGRLTAQFSTGSEAGEYGLTFHLNGGTSQRMYVTAE